MFAKFRFHLVEFVLSLLTLVILSLILISIPFDIYEFIHNKETYASVYHLDMKQQNWELEYIKRWILPFLVTSFGIVVILLRFKKPDNNIIRGINYFTVALLISIAIVGYVSWWQSGFDH